MRIGIVVLLLATVGWLAFQGFTTGKTRPSGGGVHTLDDGTPPPPPPFNPGH